MSIPSRRLLFLGLGLLGLASTLDATGQPVIRPGEVWKDTDGQPVNAHGGGILFHEGTYYWYGEIKQGKTYLPEVNKSWGGTRVDVAGVSCYSSKDLVTWKHHGNVLPAVPGTDLDPKMVLERPKVVFNKKTGKFVLWFHSDSMNYAAARYGVAVSDTPTGPFTYKGSARPHAGIWPENASEADKADKADKNSQLVKDFEKGQMVRDLTVFVDDDQKAYLFAASEGNPTMHVAELTDDYLATTGKYIRICEGRSMEAPAVFKRGGKYYMIASGCTAWAPNAARSVVADSIWGPWKELENPCKGDKADISFFSQSTYVLPVNGKPDSFIFMGDRWIKDDLADSRYIWLPITFTATGQPEIRWQDSWSVE